MASPYFKDGALNRDPHGAPKVKTFKHGPRADHQAHGPSPKERLIMASSNWASTPGPTPGSDKAVPQHKAVASGYVLPAYERCVSVQLKGTSTGKTKVPGLSGKR